MSGAETGTKARTRPALRILSRLKGIRKTAPDQFIALCPAHEDHTPSLSLRELDDRVLVFCHAGCEKTDIMSALGLTLADLFERPIDHHKGPIRRSKRWDYGALLQILRAECYVVLLAARSLRNQNKLSEIDLNRLYEAILRIESVAEIANDY